VTLNSEYPNTTSRMILMRIPVHSSSLITLLLTGAGTQFRGAAADPLHHDSLAATASDPVISTLVPGKRRKRKTGCGGSGRSLVSRRK
jgi:hypothetical protein